MDDFENDLKVVNSYETNLIANIAGNPVLAAGDKVQGFITPSTATKGSGVIVVSRLIITGAV